MRSRRNEWLLVVVASLAACAPGESSRANVSDMAEDSAVVLESVVGGGPVSDSTPPLTLWRARSIVRWGDGLAVVDNGNDRIVLLDAALHVRGTIGRSGAGPGEFEQPVSAHPSGAGLIVAEMGNRRFSEIHADGGIGRVWPAPDVGLLSLAVDGRGRVYAPSRRPDVFLARVDGDSVLPFAARPDTAAVDSLRPSVGPPEALVAITAGDTVHVFDNGTGVLHKYAPDGRLVLRRRLPASMLDSLVQRRADITRNLGGTAESVRVALLKDMSATGSGALLLLVAQDPAGALLVDPASYRARRIIVPDDAPRWTGLLRAADAVLDEPLLYVLVADSLVVFRTRSERG